MSHMLVVRHNEVKYITYMRDATKLNHKSFLRSTSVNRLFDLHVPYSQTFSKGATFQATERCPGFTESMRARVMKR
jgi:hypothetical protein